LGVHTDGGMRERIVVPARKLHPSRTLELEQLALVETLGIGAHAVERAQLEEGETVLVVGAGPIGLATLQFAALAGARVHVLEPNETRRAFARHHFDVAGCHAPGEETPPATCVFDATGNRAAMEAAFDLPAPSGRIVFVGFQLERVSFANPDFHRRELTVVSSRNSTPAEFTRVIGLLESGQIDTTLWITHRAGYDDVVETFPSWLEPETGVVKAMLELT
jgi:2-desacetyl-2-hydroxyethyl bacteriochlorophyllide A dehydrogenase